MLPQVDLGRNEALGGTNASKISSSTIIIGVEY